MVRARWLTLLVVILVVAGFAVALARTLGPSSVSVSDSLEAGAPATLALNTTFDPTTHGELSTVELDLARGFRFDPRAADVCSNAQAHAGACPDSSTIGRGTGKIVVMGTYLPRTRYNVGATFYLAEPRHAGDIAGLVFDLYETQSKLHATMFGRVVGLKHGPYGLALRFSDTDTELPSVYHLTLLAFTTLLGAQRTVGKATYNLLTNPRSCAKHGWPVQVLIDSGGAPEVNNANASCRRIKRGT